MSAATCQKGLHTYILYIITMEEYFYLDAQNQRVGPVSAEQLAAQGLTETTLVWKQGMPDWKAAGMVPELATYLTPTGAQETVMEQGASVQSPQPVQMGATPDNYIPKPDNWLVWAVVTTFCCCNIFGVVACIKAAQVNPYYESGNHLMAQQKAKEARTWVIVTAISGIVFLTLYTLFMATLGAGLGSVLESMQ